MEAERKVECLDCLTPEHKEVVCKCRCHWPHVEELRVKMEGIFKNVEYYIDNRRERHIHFQCTDEISSISLMRFVNLLFGSFKTFPVFHISTVSEESDNKINDCPNTYFTINVKY